MTWHQGGLCAFDIETTGTDVETDRIVTAAIAEVGPAGIAYDLDRYRRGKRKLTDICAHYKVTLDEAHEATADAIAAARVAWRMATSTTLGTMTLAELHTAQIGWAEEQAISLAAYFARQGRPEHVEPRWPVVPIDTRETA